MTSKPLTPDQQARLDHILSGPMHVSTPDAPPTYPLRTSHGMKQVSKPMRPRHPDDFYPTPYELCLEALRCGTDDSRPERILDAGCGTGVWGQAARELFPQAQIMGIELDTDRACEAWQTGAYDEMFVGDFLTDPFASTLPFNLVMGNPPYKHAEQFLERAYELLFRDGEIVFLLRLAFLESQGRYKRLFSNGKQPRQIMPLVERPSFTGDGKTDATAYAVFSWWYGMFPDENTTLEWLSWR